MEQTPKERILDQTSRATRRSFLEAGVAEMVERNGELPSLEKICAREGYSRGAFYTYFEGREPFIDEALEWILEDVVRSLVVGIAEGASSIREVLDRFDSAFEAGEVDGLDDVRAGYLAVLSGLPHATALRRRHAEVMVGVHRRLTEQIVGGRTGDVRDDVEATDIAMLLLLFTVGRIIWNGIGIPIEQWAPRQAWLRLLEAPG